MYLIWTKMCLLLLSLSLIDIQGLLISSPQSSSASSRYISGRTARTTHAKEACYGCMHALVPLLCLGECDRPRIQLQEAARFLDIAESLHSKLQPSTSILATLRSLASAFASKSKATT